MIAGRSLFWALTALGAGGLLKYFGEDGKILLEIGKTTLENWLHPKRAVETFKGAVKVNENEANAAVDGFGLQALQGFESKHACDIYEKLDPTKYEELIDSIGENLSLESKTVKKMKFAAYTGSTISAITGYKHGRNGFFVWGQFQLDKRENGELDLLIAVHKSSWTLKEDREAKEGEDKFFYEYLALKKRNEGSEEMMSQQATTELEETWKKFKKFSSINEGSVTLKEKDQCQEYFQKDAEKALINNCAEKRVLDILNSKN